MPACHTRVYMESRLVWPRQSRHTQSRSADLARKGQCSAVYCYFTGIACKSRPLRPFWDSCGIEHWTSAESSRTDPTETAPCCQDVSTRASAWSALQRGFGGGRRPATEPTLEVSLLPVGLCVSLGCVFRWLIDIGLYRARNPSWADQYHQTTSTIT